MADFKSGGAVHPAEAAAAAAAAAAVARREYALRDTAVLPGRDTAAPGGGGSAYGGSEFGGEPSEKKRVAKFIAKPVAPVQVVGWESVTGADAEAPLSPTLTKQASGILKKPSAKEDRVAVAEIQKAERRRMALETARNPGKGGGQWVQKPDGTWEYLTNDKLLEMEQQAELERLAGVRARNLAIKQGRVEKKDEHADPSQVSRNHVFIFDIVRNQFIVYIFSILLFF
ncbi:hypothetical protein T484DRAFT_3092156 [Baffinella frigidus]|nr:hypothetical protein T484DRAFT_3092156 [Cryptophyta sp. CCMP2293]